MPRTCPPNTTPHVIRRFDSLFAIARRYNVSVAEILAVNPQINRNSMLRISDTICIPTRIPPIHPSCPGGREYRIRPGDTLRSIASMSGISVEELLRANPAIEPGRLYNGQIVCIPVAAPPVFRCPENSFEYIIRPGDTLGNLARQYNTTVAEILRLNPSVSPGSMRISQRICIPQPRPTPRPGPMPGSRPMPR